jgi:hypothetical protein
MTIADAPTHQPVVDEAQLLFQEARQRRKRRWLISGAVTLIVMVLLSTTALVATIGGGTTAPRPVSSPVPITGASVSVATFSVRPVLCYAPPLTASSGQPAPTGTLPSCAPSYQLSAANLAVDPNPGNANGYTVKTSIQPDPQFASYASTPPSGASAASVVLLPGAPSLGDTRYVLGPVGFSASGIKSARVAEQNGQWAVNLVLTNAGSARWDALVHQQFHAMLGIVDHGTVISAPITQPTQPSFSSFDGRVQISGGFTKQAARALAAQL